MPEQIKERWTSLEEAKEWIEYKNHLANRLWKLQNVESYGIGYDCVITSMIQMQGRICGKYCRLLPSDLYTKVSAQYLPCNRTWWFICK